MAKTKFDFAPSSRLAKRVVAEAEKRGLIVLSCGVHGNVVRFLPPLTIEEATLEEALQIFERAVEAALAAHVVAAA